MHEEQISSIGDADLPHLYRKKIADALYIRGKACLECGRHVTAARHAEVLCDRGIDEAKGKTLHKEVHAFRVRRMKSNRKLAKHMGAWVEQAMEVNQLMTAESAGKSPKDEPDKDIVYGEEEVIESEAQPSVSVEHKGEEDPQDKQCRIQ